MTPRACIALLLVVLPLPLPLAATPSPAPTVATEPSTVHFCFDEIPGLPWRSRQKEGLYFELMNEVARRLELHFEYHPQPGAFCISEVSAGRMDGVFAAAFSQERVSYFAFPPGAPGLMEDALREDAILLIRRRGSAVDVIDGRLVGTTRPISVQPGQAFADELARTGWAIDLRSRDHVAQLARLSRGEYDAILISAFRWAQLQHTGGAGLDGLEALPQPILTKRYFLALSNTFANANPMLAERIWATTREVRNSDAFRRREAAAVAEALKPRNSP